MGSTDMVEVAGRSLEAAGVLVIVVGAVVATVQFVRRLTKRQGLDGAYGRYRQVLGRAVLLGLEFLVAGDIIRTVAIFPTFTSVGVLAVIVAVRTFLSFSLEVELEGRWPWQARTRNGTANVDPAP